jgi:hypothetical protein
MALQSAPKKLPRLNWRTWLLGPQQTGSEIANEPVMAQTGSATVHEPVANKTGSMPVAQPVQAETGSRTEPVLDTDLVRAWLEACSPKVHAQHLLAWLQAKGHGGKGLASVGIRDNAYPTLCAERDWDPLPWHGPTGVGKYLALLCGGRPIRKGPDGKPTRGYAIPAAVVDIAAERMRA